MKSSIIKCPEIIAADNFSMKADMPAGSSLGSYNYSVVFLCSRIRSEELWVVQGGRSPGAKGVIMKNQGAWPPGGIQ